MINNLYTVTLQAFFVTNNICYQFFIVEAEFFFHSLNSLSIFEVGREKKEGGWGGGGGGNEKGGGKKQSGLSNKRKIILLI